MVKTLKLPFQFFCTTQLNFRSRCSVKIRPLRKHEVWHAVKTEPEDMMPSNLGNSLSCLQYKKYIVDNNQSISCFPPHCGIQCSILSKACPLQKKWPFPCHKNSSKRYMYDATKLWKHTIPLTYNTKTLISNKFETLRFSPQMRLIVYPDHKTTLNVYITLMYFVVHKNTIIDMCN